MTVTRKPTTVTDLASAEQYFQGAIIDENGREIPITRAMITEACKTLEALRIEHSFRQQRTDAKSNQRFS